MTCWIRYAFTVLVFKAFLEGHTFVTFVAPEEGLFRKPKYRAIFCFIHVFALRNSSSVSSFL